MCLHIHGGRRLSTGIGWLFVTLMHGTRGEIERDYGDVVRLPETFGGLGYVAGGFVADLLRAFEAKELAGLVSGLHDAVGEEDKAFTAIELKCDLLITIVSNH